MHRQARKLLIGLAAASSLWELLIAAVLLLKPEIEAEQFHIAMTPDTLSLARIIAAFALYLSVSCALSAKWLLEDRPSGRALAAFNGAYWTLFGVVLFLRYFETRYLLMDTLRGLAMVTLSLALTPAEEETAARA